jgi:hypothetical protein
MLRIFERRILRKIYGRINDTGKWRTIHSNECYTLHDEADIAKAIKTRRLRWLGQLFRMQEVGPCRNLTVLNLLAPEFCFLILAHPVCKM